MKNMNTRKSILLLIAVVLVMAFGVGGTLAYLIDKTESVENTFTPSEVKIDIDEDFDGTTKENVRVQNTGKVKAYIRAAVLVNWKNEDGAVIPANSSDYTLTFTSGTNWTTKQADGFYYFKNAVTANGYTDYLITKAEVNAGVKAPADGYTLHVEVIAQAVQAEPDKTPATDAWGETAAALLN